MFTLQQTKEALHLANHVQLEGVYSSLVNNLFPVSEYVADFDEIMGLIVAECHFILDFKSQGGSPSTFHLVVHILDHETEEVVARYLLPYFPKWLRPYARYARYNPELYRFEAKVNTFDLEE